MKAVKVIEEAMGAVNSGDMEHAGRLLKVRADQMLQMSIVLNSAMLLEESAKLYSLLEHLENSSDKSKELHLSGKEAE